MAIDSLQKRISALIDPGGMPNPDGGLGASDRATMQGLYTFLTQEFGPVRGAFLAVARPEGAFVKVAQVEAGFIRVSEE